MWTINVPKIITEITNVKKVQVGTMLYGWCGRCQQLVHASDTGEDALVMIGEPEQMVHLRCLTHAERAAVDEGSATLARTPDPDRKDLEEVFVVSRLNCWPPFVYRTSRMAEDRVNKLNGKLERFVAHRCVVHGGDDSDG